jgi:uncharacterized phage protein (predicted DNA packaging)
MNEVVSLDDLKHHLRIDTDTEDQYLADLRASAVEFTNDALDINLYAVAPEDIPERARHIVRLLVGHWYETREAVLINAKPTSAPLAVGSLILQLRGVLVS